MPFIFLGGPYSGRAPAPDDHGGASSTSPPNGFATAVALDRVAERAWRLQLYGSSGVDGGGPNDAVLGPVVGLRDLVKQAIAQARGAAGKTPVESLDADALATLFAGLDSDYRDALTSLVSEAAFGAPEYGGNPGGAGWRLVHFEGDSMPLGYSLFDAGAGVYRERTDAPVTTAESRRRSRADRRRHARLSAPARDDARRQGIPVSTDPVGNTVADAIRRARHRLRRGRRIGRQHAHRQRAQGARARGRPQPLRSGSTTRRRRRRRCSPTTSSSWARATSSRPTPPSSRARGAPTSRTAIGPSSATCKRCRRPSAAAPCTPT